jgi:purine-nucleoside phosphorylase
VRALARWGVGGLLLTNAVGGISEGFDAGSIAIVVDHLNLQGQSPLAGPAFGARFPDLSRAYDPSFRSILRQCADAAGIVTRDAVLAAMLGPSYETPAEVRMLGRLGADIVGMSTVPEVIAAAEIGLRCAVLSLVANRAAGLDPRSSA